MPTWKKLAYYDEVAILSDATPQPVDGTAGAAGTGTEASRADHIHALGPLVANLACNKKELTNAALDNQAADPETPVVGQIYFKTGDTHPYVCTVV